MEAVNYINAIGIGLGALVIVLAGLRVALAALKITYSPDETGEQHKIIKHTLIAAAILLSIGGFIATVRAILGA